MSKPHTERQRDRETERQRDRETRRAERAHLGRPPRRTTHTSRLSSPAAQAAGAAAVAQPWLSKSSVAQPWTPPLRVPHSLWLCDPWPCRVLLTERKIRTEVPIRSLTAGALPLSSGGRCSWLVESAVSASWFALRKFSMLNFVNAPGAGARAPSAACSTLRIPSPATVADL